MNKASNWWSSFKRSSTTYWVVETWLYLCALLAALGGIGSLFAQFYTTSGDNAGSLDGAKEVTGFWKWFLRLFFAATGLTTAWACWRASEHVGELRRQQGWNNVRVPRDLNVA